MSAVVIILPMKVAEHDDESMSGREFQELRVALAAIAGLSPPRSRPCLVVDNERTPP